MCYSCYGKDYKLKNNEHRKETNKIYRSKVKEKQKAYMKNYMPDYLKREHVLEKKKERSRLDYLKNKEYYKAKTKKWAEENKDRIKKLYRSKHLKFKFNMTVEEYETMFNKQGGVCKICKLPSNKKLSIDHCHTTGKVRGLLCFTCNMGLGYFKDNDTLLNSAIKYLKNYE